MFIVRHKIANGRAPFNSFAATVLEKKQTPCSETFKSDTDRITGTDHPSFSSLFCTKELAHETRFTGAQPEFRVTIGVSFFLKAVALRPGAGETGNVGEAGWRRGSCGM